MRNESNPLLVLTASLMMKMMLVTDEGQELRRMNLSPTTKSLTTDENKTAHLTKALETTS